MRNLDQLKVLLDYLISHERTDYNHTELVEILDYMREENEPCYSSFRNLMNRVKKELAVEVYKREMDKRQQVINFNEEEQ